MNIVDMINDDEFLNLMKKKIWMIFFGEKFLVLMKHEIRFLSR
jgi:hypothetical protein